MTGKEHGPPLLSMEANGRCESTAAVGNEARLMSAFWLVPAGRRRWGVIEIHGRELLLKSKNPARRAAKRGVVVKLRAISSAPAPRPSSRGAMAAKVDRDNLDAQSLPSCY